MESESAPGVKHTISVAKQLNIHGPRDKSILWIASHQSGQVCQ